jgi:hypothetical protein
MPDDQITEDVSTAYWAAFGYHNHVLPTKVTPRKDDKLTALCGVLARPKEVSERDERPMCAWCAEKVHTGQVQVVPKPGM